MINNLNEFYVLGFLGFVAIIFGIVIRIFIDDYELIGIGLIGIGVLTLFASFLCILGVKQNEENFVNRKYIVTDINSIYVDQDSNEVEFKYLIKNNDGNGDNNNSDSNGNNNSDSNNDKKENYRTKLKTIKVNRRSNLIKLEKSISKLIYKEDYDKDVGENGKKYIIRYVLNDKTNKVSNLSIKEK